MRAGIGRVVAIAGLSASLFAVSAATASAQTFVSKYHPNASVRNFPGGASGWTGDSTSEGLCVPVLLCPSITNTGETQGGAGGANDGFIRTSLGSLTGVGATSTGFWTSPSFVYRGAEGRKANQVTFRVTRRSDVGQLLNVAGNEANYSVDLVDENTGVAVQLIDTRTLAGAPDWTTGPSVAINPDLLIAGRTYRFKITTTYVTGETVIPGGSADYDNVVLTAKQVPLVVGPPRVLNVAFLTSFINNNTSNHTRVRQNSLFVLVRCPGIARQKGRGCRFEVTGMWHRRGPTATDTRRLFLAPRQDRTIKLHLKRQYRAAIFRREEILVRYRVRVGNVRTTVYKQLRVVPR